MGMASFINLRRLEAEKAANRQTGDEGENIAESAQMEPETASKAKPASRKKKEVDEHEPT